MFSLQKLITFMFVVLHVVICNADISLTLAAANQFEGYSYPKPKTPFITGSLKTPPPEYLPPDTTTTTPR